MNTSRLTVIQCGGAKRPVISRAATLLGTLALFGFGLCFTFGCNAKSEPQTAADTKDAAASSTSESSQESGEDPKPAKSDFVTAAYDATEEQLLAARLPPEETAEGWVRLFDGQTLFGWESTGKANFRVEDGSIVVDEGAVSLLCTSTEWSDFELSLEYNADADTNSGVFVRTPIDPEDPKLDCYEINIAPSDNPFPTGSVVGRKKALPVGPAEEWREMRIIAEGQVIRVEVDGTEVSRYEDPVLLPARRIGLQHNQGRVAFRSIKIRPLNLVSLLDENLSQWKRYPEMPGEFQVTEQSELRVRGGRTQLESKQSFGDFVLLAEFKIDEPGMNSGIFFRCIPGDVMMGYECQINNDFKEGSRLIPDDCGTGGIFRRQEARVVAGENGSWASVLLHAKGGHISAWVNGVGVSNWEDDREPHENPRKGKRVEPGTLMIQGHDPGTDVRYRNLRVTEL
ncbi:MAG: DUF1080 domain-containing protein [Planctomycetota bacterium]